MPGYGKLLHKGITLFKTRYTFFFYHIKISFLYDVTAISRGQCSVVATGGVMEICLHLDWLCKDCRVACAGIFTAVIVQFQNHDQFWISHQNIQRSFCSRFKKLRSNDHKRCFGDFSKTSMVL